MTRRAMLLGLGVLTALLGSGATTAGAAAPPPTATGACAPSLVPAQSDGEAVIELAGAPTGAVDTASLSVQWEGPDNADVVAALAGPGDRFAALVAGAPGQGADLDFHDAAPSAAAELEPVGGSLVGEAAPLEPLAGLAGTEVDGPWSLIVLNTSDQDLRIAGCQLTLTLVEPGTGPAPTETATSVRSGSLPRTGGDLLDTSALGLALVGLGALLVSRRRVALLAVAGLAAGGLALVPAEPTGAAAVPVVTVDPGFVPSSGTNGYSYETLQTVAVSGLDAGQSFRLEQCESNPPPNIPEYHVEGVETDEPVRCEKVGPRDFAFTDAGIIVSVSPTTFTADGSGAFEQVMELYASWYLDGQELLDTQGSCERFTIVIGCYLRVLSMDGQVLATTRIDGGCAAEPPVAILGVAPEAGDVPLPVVADGSGSLPDGGACPSPLESYTFDFGDGTVVGPQPGATASHTYTEPGTYTLRLTVENEAGLTASTTKLVLVEVPRPDTDGDGWYDDVDNCPAASNPGQEDIDEDNLGDACDPVDDRPEPPDDEDPEEPETATCKAFQIDVIGDLAGVDWFRFDTSGRACGATDTEGPSLAQLYRSGTVVLDPLVTAVLSAMFTVQYDPDSNAGGIRKPDATTAELTGSFDLCALPLPPGVGKLAGAKLGKLLDIVSRWGGDRLIAKAARLWLGAFDKLVDLTASALPGSYNISMAQAWATVSDSLAAAFEQALGSGLNLAVGICVPMWEPTVTVVAKGDGSGVLYEISDRGLPSPRVAVATNAEAL